MEAQFVKSSDDVAQCPVPDKPEYAFIGRSNVGKSSLINYLVDKKIAKTSSTPGKTQLINHFLIENSWYLVDLPGYGYAKTSKKIKYQFQSLITQYLLNRPGLLSAFVLIDSRLEPQKIDLEFMEWLGMNDVPFSIVFTKTDKQTRIKTIKLTDTYKKRLLEDWAELPPIFLTSSDEKVGRPELVNYIYETNTLFKKA